MTVTSMTADPRWIEFNQANQAVSEGLSATPGAHERYRRSLFPYCELMAEMCENATVRRAMITALFDGGIPLGIIAGAFRATNAELAEVTERPPTQPEPVDEVERLQRMPYAAYLRTAHWQKVRQDALKRAGNRCALDNASEGLEVHHRTYERRGCERPADVVVLCEACHRRHHGTLRAA